MTDARKKVNLLNFDRTQMRAFFSELGEASFRADQIVKWIHQHGVTDLDEMTNLAKSLREKLKDLAEVKTFDIALDKTSQDGTRKWLFKLNEGNAIETVFIPTDSRGTLCISSQVGCGLNCSFCSTATQGFNRNLSTAEIIGQVFMAHRILATKDNPRPITNVVLMGMGEPLLNLDSVLPAMNLMMDDMAWGLSKYRVTLSTSGVVPEMRRLSKSTDAALAVSLHAPDDILRTQLVPINKKYPLAELVQAIKDHFPEDSKRHVTIEYVMLKGTNDQMSHAKSLIRLLEGCRVKINLIPFNPFPGTRYECSDWDTIKQFQQKLQSAGYVTTIRETRGQDTDSACGQLVGNFKDRTRRRHGRLERDTVQS